MAKKPEKKKPAAKAAKPVKKPVAKAAAKPTKKPAKVVAKKAAPKPVAKKVEAKKPAAKVQAKPAPKKPVEAKAPPAAKAAPVKKIAEKVADKSAKPVKAAPAAKPVPEKVAKKGKKPEEVEAPAAAVIEEQEGSEDDEPEEVVLTDAEGRRYCRVKDCDQLASVDGYCRYHYLLYWKKIQVRKKILSEGKLERYVEELTARYPDKFLDMLRKDLRSEKEFVAAIQELEIDESANENEFEDEAQTYIDEVRGMAEPGGREEEDF